MTMLNYLSTPNQIVKNWWTNRELIKEFIEHINKFKMFK